MDKTVRLWHVSQKVCLCVFRHLDVVTSVKFHPKVKLIPPPLPFLSMQKIINRVTKKK
jgi:WD40 repeat protein